MVLKNNEMLHCLILIIREHAVFFVTRVIKSVLSNPSLDFRKRTPYEHYITVLTLPWAIQIMCYLIPRVINL